MHQQMMMEQQMQQQQMMEDQIGAIKIVDGLFLGDEYAAQVHFLSHPYLPGPRIRDQQQSDPYHQLRWEANSEPLGGDWD